MYLSRPWEIHLSETNLCIDKSWLFESMVATVTLLGTRHNTEESIDRVEQVIRDREPDVVGVELPPNAFEDEPTWSISAAFDPREPVTLPALLLKRRLLDGDIWQVDEMFVAAKAAADVGATVALVDRPLADSLDANARALARDVLSWLRGLRRETSAHRERIAAAEWRELLARDVWTLGEWATPYVDFARALQKRGATNLLDTDARAAARSRFGPAEATTALDITRAWIPRVMATHIDERDACMAGHLRWLAEEQDDVLGVVATGHRPGVAERLNGERELDDALVREPSYARPGAVRDYPLDVE
jgi:pheromone shutdown protein TraB